MNKRKLFPVIAVSLISCGIMAYVDGILQPGYAVKSAIKIGVFFLLPLILSVSDRSIHFLQLLRPKKRGFLTALCLGIGIYALILGAYFLIRPYFDFSSIADSLTSTAGVTKENFLFVSLYISFINSFLEEFFFRGFLYTNLKGSSKTIPSLFSATLFSLYHVAMMIGWFSPFLFALVMAGLLAGGIIFNWLNEKTGTIYCSWLTHMFANFAINTIGFILLK